MHSDGFDLASFEAEIDRLLVGQCCANCGHMAGWDAPRDSARSRWCPTADRDVTPAMGADCPKFRKA